MKTKSANRKIEYFSEIAEEWRPHTSPVMAEDDCEKVMAGFQCIKARVRYATNDEKARGF